MNYCSECGALSQLDHMSWCSASTGRQWFTCTWEPDELNPGPDCPYCAGEMCARLDGIWGCRHDREERHGFDRDAIREAM